MSFWRSLRRRQGYSDATVGRVSWWSWLTDTDYRAGVRDRRAKR